MLFPTDEIKETLKKCEILLDQTLITQMFTIKNIWQSKLKCGLKLKWGFTFNENFGTL